MKKIMRVAQGIMFIMLVIYCLLAILPVLNPYTLIAMMDFAFYIMIACSVISIVAALFVRKENKGKLILLDRKTQLLLITLLLLPFVIMSIITHVAIR